MDHGRVLRVVLGVTAGYLILLGLWLGWLIHRAPPGTVPYQIVAMVGLFGSCLGLGMLLATRPSRADRELWRHGLEGWATVKSRRTLERTDHHSELTRLELELTVPGTETYTGSITFDLMPADSPKLAVGETVSIRVDPANRDRIILVL
ncbi:DUF3592 domain-containing protein [Nocardia goodfellowii]|uniref:DUF4175 domain-containing protein n=1 Tax=Nocardia goodfellowii TaxID=882446 RepID=A0ABS4QA08_9NOCA|nr:hypothetical protein [Nocardia goodfellowii]MBP2188534.1 hypothetical protein [Nocardia goodfellowii]